MINESILQDVKKLSDDTCLSFKNGINTAPVMIENCK